MRTFSKTFTASVVLKKIGCIWILALMTPTIWALTPRSAESAQSRIWTQALKQSQTMSLDWDPSQRDCAGFVRFLFRSAVTGHARMWENDKKEKVDFLSAGALLKNNFRFLGRNREDIKLQTGDILAYFRPDYSAEDAWHLMVLLDPRAQTSQTPLVIYHNGASGAEALIKKISFSELAEYSWGPWRPIPENPMFQGYFRWKGFDEPAASNSMRGKTR